MPFALASSFVTAAFLVLHPASFNRPSLHFIAFHSLICPQAPSFGLLQPAHIPLLKQPRASVTAYARLITLHSVTFSPHSLSKLQSIGCPCCARLRLSFGLRAVMPFASSHCWPTLNPTPFNNQPHKSKRSRQPLCSPAFNHAHTYARPTYMVRRRFLRQLSLLSPYLLLADSLRFSSFALGGSQDYKVAIALLTHCID